MNIALQKQIQIQSHTGINILAHVCVCVCVLSHLIQNVILMMVVKCTLLWMHTYMLTADEIPSFYSVRTKCKCTNFILQQNTQNVKACDGLEIFQQIYRTKPYIYH